MKTIKLFSLLLIFCILFPFIPAYADKPNETLNTDDPATHEITEPLEIIAISNVEDFLSFTENCRLDSYSRNKHFILEADLDLSDHIFAGVPIFSGTFDGNNHSISGVQLQNSGSNIGFFRYLTESACISNLHLIGTISPSGSACVIGGIAGKNAGLINNCKFSGFISGIDYIGGIAGINEPSGAIKECINQSEVFGNHFVGGIAGSNEGIISDSENYGQINTKLQQNKVTLSDITMESITGSEAAVTVTDIGGIAGINSGSLGQCKNGANVGYPQIGYNIGGIAGSHTGYLFDCINNGMISGRKDVGGIVGQLEPSLAITYTTDTLQILRGQLNDLASYVDIATKNATNSISAIKNQFILIEGQIDAANNALAILIPQEGIESLPTIEEIKAVVTTVENSISGIFGNIQKINDNIEYADAILTRDLENIKNAIAGMQETLDNASDHLGGSVTDESDADTEDDLTAKIVNCENFGEVLGDRNIGGIAGTVAFENDLDHESDITILGESTLNFSGAYRAVIGQCQNYANIICKKQFAGGIAGFATIGLIRSCANYGILNCPAADYIGGIAGRSDGIIRNSLVKSQITAQETAGGIAGQGMTVSDCLSLVTVSGIERVGFILGHSDDPTLLSHNYCIQTQNDLGAVDGINYEFAAQPISAEAFLSLDALPEQFKTYCVTFVFFDGTSESITLNTANALSSEQIPSLPEIDGCNGTWINIPDSVYFDCTVTCEYDSRKQVLQCQNVRNNGLPILLAEGSFLPNAVLNVTPLPKQSIENYVEGWEISLSTTSSLHYLPPDGYDPHQLQVQIRNADGSWQTISHTQSGRYLVFSSGEGNAFRIVRQNQVPWLLYIGIGITVFLVVLITIVVLVKRHRKKIAVNSQNR